MTIEANTTLKSTGQGLLHDTAGKIQVRILTLRKLPSSELIGVANQAVS